ncbi:hypothetical protein K461DRAFT_291536 [Myriangium duriaei CBS 260.36]|uniref:Uncharacterized protein n=1 Tax=Myriangium duriaei CBS 260.36 TaxID=1168546 RepID=A0A9P4J5R5_9PEZI|nr:hypothetical protein K461DRAFT_291536 [Myriangium duriaei CBS 260.36]
MDPLGTPGTPTGRSITTFGELSPPSSQGTAPTAASAITSSPSVPNANGKRPASTLDNNSETSQPTSRPPAASRGVSTMDGQQDNHSPRQTKVHEASGYTWSRQEDEPGWGWRNKRAVEDAERAWNGVLNKERKIGNRYGDPFEMADNEAATLASRQTK